MTRLRDFINESPEYSLYDADRFQTHLDNVNAHKKEVEYSYEDDSLYDDRAGEKWMLNKKRDNATLISAALDGIIDKGLDIEPEKFKKIKAYYDDIMTIDELYAMAGKFSSRIRDILEFLNQYKKGYVKVYRGCAIEKNVYDAWVNKSVKPNILLAYLDNTKKEFNSYSTSYDIAKTFAKSWGNEAKKNTHVPIIISGYAEPNDIYWAFTAYLIGRHGTTAENELNIKPLKQLKDMKVEVLN
jgi:hypothetical protein